MNNEKTTETTPTDPERLDLPSHDIADAKRHELLRLFPEVRTEGGKLDFDRLKLALGESVDVGRERYGLTWPGKAECFKAIQAPSMGTLRPCPEESVNFDTTENLMIEGDNLEVLKLLQKSYLGKVKMIYIDPPYNTGNDFIYPDNYTESLQTYLEYTGQVDSQGKKFSTNTEADGRFHSKWLSMMYPRLYLARNLLCEDGVMFVSIDDHERDNLARLCNEVFGEENFVATLVWQKTKKSDAKLIATVHEYVVIYARNKRAVIEAGIWRKKKPGVDAVLERYDEVKAALKDEHDAIGKAMRQWYGSLPKKDSRRAHAHYKWSDSRGLYFAADFAGPDDGRDSRPRYDIPHPVTGRPCSKPSTGWRWEEDRTRAALAADPPLIHFGPDETTIPCRKTYLRELTNEPFSSVFYRDGRAGTLELEDLVGKGLLEFPKDKDVLADFIDLVTRTGDIVLDCFAGSGTTAQAVLELNRRDAVKRLFVLVQLPEPLDREGYRTIADVTKARIRKVCASMLPSEGAQRTLATNDQHDCGFRVFKLCESNFETWNADAPGDPERLGRQLELHVDHIRPGRTTQDVLYEILLKSGYPPTTRAESMTLEGKTVYSVQEGAFIICLERELSLGLVRALAERKPERVVFLDAGFAGKDQLKANAVQILRSKGLTSFKTV